MSVVYRDKNRITQRQLSSRQHGSISRRVLHPYRCPVVLYDAHTVVGAVLARRGRAVVYPTTSSVRRDHEKRPCGSRPRWTLGAAARSGRGSGSERRQQVQEHSAGWPERQQPAWCYCGRTGPGQEVPGARASAAAAAAGASTGSASGASTGSASGASTAAASGASTAAASGASTAAASGTAAAAAASA